MHENFPCPILGLRYAIRIVCPSQRLIFWHLIRFRTKLVILDAIIQIYATPSVILGRRVFG